MVPLQRQHAGGEPGHARGGAHAAADAGGDQVVLSSLVRHLTVKTEEGFY